MLLTITNFRGLAPRYAAEDLADDLAVESINTRPGYGQLCSWGQPQYIAQTRNDVASIYLYLDTFWFESSQPTEYTEVPLINDPYDYIVMTDGDYPKITRNDVAVSAGPYPTNSFRLGVPIPSAIIAIVSLNPDYEVPDPAPDDSAYDEFNTSYKLTIVDDWGRESAGSSPSNLVDIREIDDTMAFQVTLRLPSPPSGNHPITSAARWRIYRRNMASDSSGVYQFLVELPVTTTSYVDKIVSADLQEEMVTDDWLGAPDDDTSVFPNGPLRNICVIGSLFMAGHNEKMVCFSEPDTTHVWPAEYYQPHTEKIIRTIPRGADLVVLTDSFPYIYSGVHPSAMSPVKLPYPVPLAHRDGAAEVAGKVFYVSPRGLYAIDGYEVTNVSEAFFNQIQWEALDPVAMRLRSYRDYLILTTAAGYSLVLNATDIQDGFRKLDITVDAFWRDGEKDALYYSAVGDNRIFEFDADRASPLGYVWESKHFNLNRPVAMTVARVRASSYPASITIKARKDSGAVAAYSKNVSSSNFFYLPCGFTAQEWWVESSGDAEIREIQVASGPAELGAL